jgi:hypothetical protein
MKTMIEKFSGSLLSRGQMKVITGGRSYFCYSGSYPNQENMGSLGEQPSASAAVSAYEAIGGNWVAPYEY